MKSQTQKPAYLDTKLSLEKRVNDLIGRMTLEEKINQMKYNAPEIKRLGIPKYNWWHEGLHGVARAGYATVFPQAINLASMWDTEMMYKVATAISDEARAKHHEFLRKGKRGLYQGLTFWSPNINIFRDPRWGRGHETYGEDPYLTGETGLAFVRGMQGDDPKYFKTIATPKHYAVHSGPEPERHTFDARISERDLRETYLPAFRRLLVDGKAFSVMCAYNRFRGKPCCGSDELLAKILREEWKFQGYVVSDCWAVEDFYEYHKVVKTPEEAVSMSVKAGTDLSCGSCYPRLYNAVQQGLISEKEIDNSVRRLFTARFKLGMFDPPDMVPYTKIPYSVNNSKKNSELALEAARKSIVLLKNQNNILPLKKDIKRIALIGPNSNDLDVLIGNYNGIPSNPVTLLKGLKNKLPNARIVYTQGCNLAESIFQFEPVPSIALRTEDGQEGLTGEYFTNQECSGKPLSSRIDKNIDFLWFENIPVNGLEEENYSVKWSGYITSDKEGEYRIGVKAFNGVKFYFEDSLLYEGKSDHEPVSFSKQLEMKANRKFKICIEYTCYHNYGMAQLLWAKIDNNMLTDAIENVKKSDIAILALGLSPRLEGEEMQVNIKGFNGGDRTDIELPASQLELMQEIHKTGKPVILVIFSGSALALNWAEKNIPGILQAGYPGQRGGDAIADVLFGDYNPAGRLPLTYYKSIDQIPEFSNYNMDGKTYRYFSNKPLYPFGFGLSYTKFQYTNFKVEKSEINTGEDLKISIDVENTGNYDGEEVVELYIKNFTSSMPKPIISLQGFKRMFLKKGEVKKAEFLLTSRQMSIIDNKNDRVIEPGEIEVYLGGSLPDLKIVNGNSQKIRITGEKIKIEN